MTQHAELTDRLRCFDRVTCNEAADAIEALEREIARVRGWISVAQAELDGVEIAHDNNCLSAAQGALKRALAPAIQHEGASNAGS